ncbi:MAG TPA: BTAD domain-containing putative transcriptional regulator, partial [Candidatus Aquilonibacter sp.]
ITAPLGFGKTILLQQYAADHPDGVWVRGEQPEAVYVHALELEMLRYLMVIDDGKTREFLIDDVDLLTPTVIAELFELAHRAPRASFVWTMRTREVIPDHRCLIDGTADLLDANALAFTEDEVAELCARYSVEVHEGDLRALIREADGWPLLVNSAIEKAAREGLSLRGIFRSWLDARGDMLREIIESAASKDVIERDFRGNSELTVDQLRNLERKGLFVLRRGREYAMLHAVEELFAAEKPATIASDPPITMHLLGEFQLWIGETRVKWLRRRDAHLVKYLALSSNGQATRDELCRVFWPGNERAHALQNLRTTCCNIRAAFRAAAPDRPVESFIETAGSELRLIFDRTRTDIAEFDALIASGNDALDSGRIDEAVQTFERAARAFHGSLIVEPAGAFYSPMSAELERRFTNLQKLRAQLQSVRPKSDSSVHRSARTSPVRSAVREIVPCDISTVKDDGCAATKTRHGGTDGQSFTIR